MQKKKTIRSSYHISEPFYLRQNTSFRHCPRLKLWFDRCLSHGGRFSLQYIRCGRAEGWEFGSLAKTPKQEFQSRIVCQKL